jgi:hypothetical protein
MPQKTKGGLLPTHQPKFPEYRPNSKRSNTNEKRQQSRLNNKIHQKSPNIPRQTHKYDYVSEGFKNQPAILETPAPRF